MSSFTRLFVSGLLLTVFAIAACEDTTKPPPPPPAPQIKVNYRYTFNPNVTVDTVNGLQSNDAYDIIVDSQDRTWVATQAGVSRFRGKSGDGTWNQTNVLPNPKCRALLEHNGKLWVGTWGGGAATYDMATETWSWLDVDSGLVNDMVGDIDAVGDSIYFATNDGASLYTDVDSLDVTQRFETLPVGRGNGGILVPVVSAVVVAQTTTRGREIWFGPRWDDMILPGQEDDLGITVFREGLSQPIYLTMANSALSEPKVNDIFYDPATELFWVAFATTGLASVDVDASTWTYYTSADGLPSDLIYSITKVDDAIWVGTQGGVARQLPGGKWRGYARSGGLPGDRVRRVFSNDPTKLWVGFIDRGAALLDPRSAQ